MDRKALIIDLMSHEDYRPMKIKELAILLALDKEEKKELDGLLQNLIKEGKVILTKRGGKYMLNESNDYLVGRFVSHQKGFGFVEIEGGEDEDVFIPSKYVSSAFHHDTVAIQLLKESRGKRKEGQVVEILERGKDTLVGIYEPSDNYGFVVPDNKKMQKDIFVSKNNTMNAMKGHKVVVKISDWGGGGEDKKPEGEIIEIIGHIDDPETAILSIVRSLDIPTEFPKAVKDQVKHIPQSVDAEMAKGRLDMRGVLTVTIDGADAKDLDDAITIEKIEHGHRLGVHIADVTHYVKEGSPIDVEALERSTSVYLVDRVIPMIPRQLSNGICSLNAHEDRLALSCIMDINNMGEVLDYQVAETLINVNERMTYKDVAAIINDEDESLKDRYKECVGMFKEMEALAAILRKKRKKTWFY